mmetsp:Transcript_7413/g.7627  ORF Transcript_7413/g.7627 Transcript_7413/m.7627 type:complete len:861 (+) Transcript_7413:176-2758(+)
MRKPLNYLLSLLKFLVLTGLVRRYSSIFNVNPTQADLCNTFNFSNINLIQASFSCIDLPICSSDNFPGVQCNYVINSSYISSIDFSNKEFNGYLPINFDNESFIQYLNLSHNQLHGSIPDTYSSSLPHLLELDLSNNILSGTIPSSLCSISSLTRLSLRNNNNILCYHSCFLRTSLWTDFIKEFSECEQIKTNSTELSNHTVNAFTEEGKEIDSNRIEVNEADNGDVKRMYREVEKVTNISNDMVSDQTTPICINITLIDLLGEGWGSAYLVIMSSGGLRNELVPNCLHNPTYIYQCFSSVTNKNNDYIILKVVGFAPERPWEITWSVLTSRDHMRYIGGYETSLMFIYHEIESDTGRISDLSLLHVDALINEHERICHECINTYQFYSGPRGTQTASRSSSSSSSVLVTSRSIPRPSSSQAEDIEGVLDNRENEADTPIIDAVSESLPNTTIAMASYTNYTNQRETSKILQNDTSVVFDRVMATAFDPKTDGRALSTRNTTSLNSIELNFIYELSDRSFEGYGSPRYYISTANEELLISGALCSTGQQSVCGMSFPAGDYTLRVTGSVSSRNKVTWSFCGVAGEDDYILIFTIKHSRCFPQVLKESIRHCVASDQKLKQSSSDTRTGMARRYPFYLADATVSIHGVIELEGMGEGPLSAEETVLLRSAIAQEFRDAQVDNTPLYEDVTSVEPLMTHSSTRRLEDETESSANTKQVLFKVKMSMPTFDVKELKTYLDQSMSSGLFVTRVRALSNTASNMKMQGLTKASLLDLRVIHETLENKTFSIEASLVMAVCGIAGLVFSILLLKSLNHKTEQGYAHLKTTDIDTTDSQTNGYSEVTATDMDVTINSEAGLIQESGV